MLTYLLRLIGVSDEILVHLDQAVLAFQRPELLWVGLALLIPIGFFIIRRQHANLATATPGLRTALDLIRLAILGLLVLVLAGPYLRLDYEIDKRRWWPWYSTSRQACSFPLALFEASEGRDRLAQAVVNAEPSGDSRGGAGSDGQRALLDTMSRARLAGGRQRQLEGAAASSGRAVRRPRLCVCPRGGSTRGGLEAARARVARSGLRHDAAATHLGDALARVLDDAAGRPVAGVILFTDGQNTGGRSPAESGRRPPGSGLRFSPSPPGRTRGSGRGHRGRFHLGARLGRRHRAGLSHGRVARVRRPPVKVDLREGTRYSIRGTSRSTTPSSRRSS